MALQKVGGQLTPLTPAAPQPLSASILNRDVVNIYQFVYDKTSIFCLHLS